MKHLLLTAIAAVVVVGCATTQQSAPPAEANTGVTPLHRAASKVHKEIAERLIAEGADVNANVNTRDVDGETPLDVAIHPQNSFNTVSKEIADLLRKHGAKTSEELKAEGK